MSLKKGFDLEKGININLTNGYDNSCIIYYSGDDLCFKCYNYSKENSFYILKNEELYLPMRELFKYIKAYDKLFYISRNKLTSKFEWLSDGMLPGMQNRLSIVETTDGYCIKFIMNRNNNQKECLVKFSLVNSNNQKIANAFDKMISNTFIPSNIDKNKKVGLK